jgi:tetratricopeptide (TPR) repeat protein
MKRWMIGVAIAGAALAPRVLEAQRGGGWVPPDCQLSTSHYLVNSGLLYLRTASSTRFADERQRQLRDARRVLTQAAEQGQGDNGAVWYFLGRYYLEMNDVPGMDSAFDRADRLAPQCAADTRAHRRRVWVPVLNNAVERIKANDNDAAIGLLHQANGIYDGEPPGFYYLGQIYANKGQQDSAIVYFSRAIQIARDSANRENEQAQQLLKDATFNVASTYHMQKKYDSAVVWYQEFRTIQPGDAQAMTRMADALSQAGRDDEAIAIYDSVLARKDSMPAIDLFQAGVAMFESKRFERAAEAFESGLERNPFFRDALFNLANTYLSMANAADSGRGAAVTARKKELGEKMTPVVRRLTEVDPQNVPARRLQAAAFQLQNLQDSTLRVLEGIEAMTFELQVSQFAPAGSGFDVRGIMTNRTDSTITTPPLTFDFLSATGDVVQSITVDPKPIPGGELAPFQMAPVGEGIVAWRYRVES